MTNHDDRIRRMSLRSASATGGWMLAAGLLVSLTGGAVAAKGGGAGHGGRPPEACQATARMMLQSCSAEVTEQNKALLAN